MIPMLWKPAGILYNFYSIYTKNIAIFNIWVHNKNTSLGYFEKKKYEKQCQKKWLSNIFSQFNLQQKNMIYFDKIQK
jgi:hypothetical protein